MSYFFPLLQGFVIGAGLIIAIGAQNAFVLKQGIKREHVFITASICSVSDAFLITLGVTGLGALIARSVIVIEIAKWGGAAFLTLYGFFSFKSAYRPSGMALENHSESNLRTVVLTILAFTYLNPHVYLDVIIVGSIGAQFSLSERPFFSAGVILASFAWFFLLGYGAGWLAPIFRRPMSWRILDSVIGCVMLFIAVSLIW